MSVLSWGDVRSWSADGVESLATGAGHWGEGVGVMADGVKVGGSAGGVSGWLGDGAAAAVAQGASLSGQISVLEREMLSARGALARAASGVREVESGVKGVYGFASGMYLRVGDDGSVTDSLGPYDDSAELATRQSKVDECVALMQSVLDRAVQVETALVAALRGVAEVESSWWDRAAGQASEWVDDTRSWVGEHAQVLRQVGKVTSTIGKVGMGVAGALAAVGGVGAFFTGGVSAAVLLPVAGAVATVSGLLWGAGDALQTTADWGEGKISGKELLVKAGISIGLSLIPFGVGKLAKLEPVRKGLSRVGQKIAEILERLRRPKAKEPTPPKGGGPGPGSEGSGAPTRRQPPANFGSEAADVAKAQQVTQLARENLALAQQSVMADAAKRGVKGTPEEILKQLEAEQVARLTPADRAAIEEAQAKAAAAEKDIRKVVLGVAGDNLVGLEHSVKTTDSLMRKVAGEVAKGKDSMTVLANIKDAVRYTVKIPEGQYARESQSIIDELQAAGYESVSFKNTWSDAARKNGSLPGINSQWKLKGVDNAQVFEVQIHTEASLAAREETHKIYDFIRLPDLSDDLESEIFKLQKQVFDLMPSPPGVDTVVRPIS